MDWKGLNSETQMNGWPLPNIRDIIHRLGEKKAKYFAVIDLTQGYWQIPISELSRHLTAFRSAEHFDEHSLPPEQVARFDEAYKGIKAITDHKFSNERKYKTDLLVTASDDESLGPLWLKEGNC